RIGQFRGDSEFTTWLYRLVINSCLDERRKQKRFLPVAEFAPTSKAVYRKSPETRYERREIAGSVRAAIGGLKPKMRLPIFLKYIEGLSYEEIAEVLGCSKGTVASRLNRAHKALAKKLSHLRGELELEPEWPRLKSVIPHRASQTKVCATWRQKMCSTHVSSLTSAYYHDELSPA